MSDAYAPPTAAVTPALRPRSRLVAIGVGLVAASACWLLLAIALNAWIIATTADPFGPGAPQEIEARMNAIRGSDPFAVFEYFASGLVGGLAAARFRRGPWRAVALGVAGLIALIVAAAAQARFGYVSETQTLYLAVLPFGCLLGGWLGRLRGET
jgi:hypothetical protein